MIHSLVEVGRARVGDPGQFTVIAGPCAIESLEQFQTVAQAVQSEGVHILRGGMFKLRTNPNSFQGLGALAWDVVRQVKKETGLAFISEITDPRQITDVADFVDIFQVGSRNMYNYALLKELGHYRKPVLLKRGFSALLDEWICAADYIVQAGNPQVILCERGIRTFETKMRNTLDLSAVAYVKKHTQLPIIVDPSHGTGRPELIPPMALAAAACGADGIMVEVHPDPKTAKSDGFQALTIDAFHHLMTDLRRLLPALGRSLE